MEALNVCTGRLSKLLKLLQQPQIIFGLSYAQKSSTALTEWLGFLRHIPRASQVLCYD